MLYECEAKAAVQETLNLNLISWHLSYITFLFLE